MNNDIKDEIKKLGEEYLSKDADMLLTKEISLLFKKMYERNIEDDDLKRIWVKLSRKVFFHQIALSHQLLAFENSKREFLINHENIIHADIFKIKEEEYSYAFSLNSPTVLDSYVAFFFQKTSDSLYHFYCELRDSGHIIINQKEKQNQTFLIDRDHIYLLVNSMNTILDSLKLIGEIGRAYYYSLHDEMFSHKYDATYQVKEEIPVRVLQLFFIKFLYSINKRKMANNLKHFFKEEIKNCSKIRNTYEKFQKEMASYLAYKYINEVLVEKIYQEIYDEDCEELLYQKRNTDKTKEYLLRRN